ncbi:hypothetical protein ILUMI_16195 [Ignelater luminosus]|uniref:DUF5641 domain-containing protein n=1 Tax=Ignelater luminosus TaxID=2038154 RepID=A0A8K0G667_IGNLU|nr:hypothetical protein ILUMI_16195 [Ignelater luminosus]
MLLERAVDTIMFLGLVVINIESSESARKECNDTAEYKKQSFLLFDHIPSHDEDHLPPLQWRMGRIQELHPGADGVTRVVPVRTQNSVVRRFFAKLCPLPNAEDDITKTKRQMVKKTTRQPTVRRQKIRQKVNGSISKGDGRIFAAIVMAVNGPPIVGEAEAVVPAPVEHIRI